MPINKLCPCALYGVLHAFSPVTYSWCSALRARSSSCQINVHGKEDPLQRCDCVLQAVAAVSAHRWPSAQAAFLLHLMVHALNGWIALWTSERARSCKQALPKEDIKNMRAHTHALVHTQISASTKEDASPDGGILVTIPAEVTRVAKWQRIPKPW